MNPCHPLARHHAVVPTDPRPAKKRWIEGKSHWGKHAMLVLAAGVITVIAADEGPTLAERPPPCPTEKVLYEVELFEVGPAPWPVNCLVTFHGKLPEPSIVDKLLRATFQTSILITPTRDIFANAYFGDEILNRNQYSGLLSYQASEKRMMTRDEASGDKITSTDETA